MREVCGIVFIYTLYFKEPVINFGRVGKDDFFFGSMSFHILCALQLCLLFSKDAKYGLSDFDIWSHI